MTSNKFSRGCVCSATNQPDVFAPRHFLTRPVPQGGAGPDFKTSFTVSENRLQYYANHFNQLFCDASVSETNRPRFVGALMLALWQSKKDDVELRRTDGEVIADVQKACRDAFAGAKKVSLGEVLASQFYATEDTPGTAAPKPSPKVIKAAQEILLSLETLNVGKTEMSTDFLGALYEDFFRYTGAAAAPAVVSTASGGSARLAGRLLFLNMLAHTRTATSD
jgi:hypothetical protein